MIGGGGVIRAAEIEAVLLARDQMTAVLQKAKQHGIDLQGAMRSAGAAAQTIKGDGAEQLGTALNATRGHADGLRTAQQAAGAAGAAAGSAAAAGAREAGSALETATQKGGGFSHFLTSIRDQAVGFAAGGFLQQGISKILGAVGTMGIGMNASLETSTLQFTTLMGNADAARQHVQMLFQFAKDTPFETEPVIKASRMLRTFGGDALDTKANLTLVGDASAAAGADISDLSFWVGRMYAGLQAGQPIGEAVMRMQELAVLSPKTAAEIQKMQAAGAKSSDIWKLVTDDLHRFNGAMKAQASTWSGLTSSLSDAVNITGAKILAPFFEHAKARVSNFLDFISSPAVSQAADAMAAGLAQGFDIFDKLQSSAIGTGVSALRTLGNVFGFIGSRPEVARILQALSFGLKDMVTSLRSGNGPLNSFLWFLSTVHEQLGGTEAQWDAFVGVLQRVFSVVDPLILPFRNLGGIIGEISRDVSAGASPWTILTGVLTQMGFQTGTTVTLVGALRLAWGDAMAVGQKIGDVIGFIWDTLGRFNTIAMEVAKRAMPMLRDTGKELAGAFGEVLGSFKLMTTDLQAGGASFDTATKGLQSAQDGVHGTQTEILGFISSEAVARLLAFFAVDLPSDILVAVRWFKVLADSVAVALNTIGTTVRVTGDIAKGDWNAAWRDMEAGGAREVKLMAQQSLDLHDAVVSTNELMDGTVEGRSEAFKNRMLSLFDEMRSGTISDAKAQKEEVTAQHKEMHENAIYHAAALRAGVNAEVGGLTGDLHAEGVNAATGLGQGMHDTLWYVRNEARQMAREARDAARTELGNPQSPSPVFAKLGHTIPEGLAWGIDMRAHLVSSAMKRMTPAALAIDVGAAGGAAGAAAAAVGPPGGGFAATFNFHGVKTVDPGDVAGAVGWWARTARMPGGR